MEVPVLRDNERGHAARVPFVQGAKTGGDVMVCHTNPPPTSNPPTMRTSGSDNVFIGYKAGCFGIGSSTPWPAAEDLQDNAPAPVWHCAYCGQSNAAEREGCRGCQAARPEEVESESFKDRWEAKYKGTESWADIAVVGSGWAYDGFIESGKVSPRRQLLNRIKQCVGLR